MPNALQEELTTEERRRRIAEALRMFELSAEVIDAICSRMIFYVENFPARHGYILIFSSFQLCLLRKSKKFKELSPKWVVKFGNGKTRFFANGC